jgi:uncharacterized LabA/DUF88 family protein
VGKNVAVFVDVANIFYAAKAAGVDIDYVLLLKEATAGRDLVRAYAYTGLDPENENQRNFHSFLGRHGFRVVSKDIRKYGDGRVKANLDIELVVDMMKTARNLDVAVVVSGDGDFAPAIRAVQEMGVRVEVISFRGNTSADLMEVADKFTDITRLALAGKVAPPPVEETAEEADLSMTAVPEKESAGPARGRGRGRTTTRGRERVETAEKPERAEKPARVAKAEPAHEPAAAAPRPSAAALGATEAGLVALPGEKLAKARHTTEQPQPEELSPEAAEAAEEAPEEGETLHVGDTDEQAAGEGPHRRRRRRGGRGRGRGRGTEELAGEAEPRAEEPPEEDIEELVPRAPRPGAFGSVWDSQIGIPSAPRPVGEGHVEEIDEEEPEIPEYLLAERRRSQARDRGRGRPGRGGAYVAAMERERFGRAGVPRYGEPPRGAPARGGQGSNAGDRFPRRDAHVAPAASRPDRAESRSSEPWSEVPPEVEEMLRAQLAQKLAPRGEAGGQAGGEPVGTAAQAPAPARRRRTASAASGSATAAAVPPTEAAAAAAAAPAAAAPARRTRRTAPAAPSPASVPEPPAAAEGPAAQAPAPARRRRTASAASGSGQAAEPASVPVVKPGAAAPARRPRRTAAAGQGAPSPEAPEAAPEG